MNPNNVTAMTVNLVAKLIAELGNRQIIPKEAILEILNGVINDEQDPSARQEIQSLVRRLFPGIGI